jgi:hypothetical protein
VTTPGSAEGRDRWCGAKKRQGEGTCHRPAGWGTDHPGAGRCKLHGGSTRNLRTKAHRDGTLDAARRLTALHDVVAVDDPIAALLGLAGQLVALVDVLRSFVADLSSVAYEGDKTGEQIKGELQVYLAAAARAESILTNIIRLNLEERLVRVNEAQSDMVVVLIEHVLARAGLEVQAVDVRSWVADELEALAS